MHWASILSRMTIARHCIFAILIVAPLARAADPLPEVVLTSPGMRLDHSCRVVIPPGTFVAATDGAPAIVIAADNLIIEFAPGSVLRGAPDDRPLDQLVGTGISVEGRHGVTLRNLTVSGYHCAIHATRAADLAIDHCRVESNFSQRLKSNPQVEDYADWLWPHHNESNQWLTSYGAAIYLEDSSRATIHNVSVRRSQNGILLDEVADSRVYDCECSFLSGWGIGLWKSSRNTIARNALDFCIRGYSHNVYNRGQDSNGLMVFEQSSSNIFAENSATHCGDAFFSFAGRDALGETWIDAQKAAKLPTEPVPESEITPRVLAGCNDNLLLGNDFSFAAIHGIEMTFSARNRFINNIFFGDGVCGIWGGFSSSTLITGNTFTACGQAGYAAQRGAINIEHGRDNRIVGNTFRRNAIGVRLWANLDSPHFKTPWGRANADPATRTVPSTRTTIDRNSFTGEPTALQVRNSTAINFSANSCTRVRQEIDVEKGATVDLAQVPPIDQPALPATLPGTTRPVGARDQYRGREFIVMTEWGPWDFSYPFVRLHHREAVTNTDVFEVFGATGPITVTPEKWGSAGDPTPCRIVVAERPDSAPLHVSTDIRVEASDLGPGVWPYALHITAPNLDHHIRGVLVNAGWSLTCFPWTHDPLTDLAGWRADSKLPAAITVPVRAIVFPLGYRGPSKIGIAPAIDAANIGANHYGIIARTTLNLAPGRWALRTVTDDGIRVIVDGTPVIERWDIHVPTPDLAILTFDQPHAAEIVVEYFQNEGHAELSIIIEPAPDAP